MLSEQRISKDSAEVAIIQDQQDDFKTLASGASSRLPRIFIVEPQRLFMEAMRELLATDLDIVGIGRSPRCLARAGSLDLIIIDADAVRPSEACLVEMLRRTGAIPSLKKSEHCVRAA